MSEGSRLRRAIYARMEETSFRAGAALAAGVLAVTGLGIALTVTLGGGHRAAAAPRAVRQPATVNATPAFAPPPSWASAVPLPSAGPSAIQDAAEPVPVPAAAGTSGPQTTRAPSPQASPATSSPWPTPRPIPSRPSYPSQSPPFPPPWWWPRDR